MIKKILYKNETAMPNSREIDALREYFPTCFKEDGSFDIGRFREFLSNKLTVTHEGYELKFLGKNYARLLASLDTTTVIVPDEEHNSKPENVNSENIYISGDNLDGLKHLLKSYSRRVKCIYIDPPYNTGSDGFVYNDNFCFSVEELSQKLSIGEDHAQRVLDMTKRGSASHSAWLMFIYPRLLLARDLLTDDGVIFISIDDNEQGNLRLLCDDVFGEENCVAQIIVQSNKRGQTYKQFAKTHEYLLCYTRNVHGKINELIKEVGSFTMADHVSEFSERELRNRNPKYGRFNRPNLFYPIFVDVSRTDENGYCPVSLTRSEQFSVEVLPYNSEGAESCWRWGTSKLIANNNDDTQLSNIVARMKSTNKYGIFEKYRKTTFKAKTIWFDEFVVNDLLDEEDDIWDETGVITEQGSVELGNYKMGDVFDFPKPTYLIRKVLSLGSDSDSICVDFFSGSATTAEAVFQLNASSDGKSKRHFIAIQLPEDLEAKLEKAVTTEKPKIQRVIDFLDRNSHPRFLNWIGIERIKCAAESIRKDRHLTTTELDLGFRHYTLVEPSQRTLDKLEKFDPNDNVLIASGVLTEFGKATVLTTWLNSDGYGLTAKPEEIDFAGYKGNFIGKHLYLIEERLSNEAIKAILMKFETDGDFNPENVVLFGYSFLWTERENLQTNLKRLKDTEKNLRVNFDIRY